MKTINRVLPRTGIFLLSACILSAMFMLLQQSEKTKMMAAYGLLVIAVMQVAIIIMMLAGVDFFVPKKTWQQAGIEESFQLLVNSVKDYAIFMLDVNGLVLTWNEGAERIKGYAAAEIKGMPFSVFYTKEQISSGEPQMNLAAARQHGRYESKGWRVRKDGSVFWADVIFTALYDDRRRLKGFAKITRDVTKQKNAEEKLLRFNEDLEEKVRLKTAELTQVFERITDAFIALDKNWNYTYVNKKAAEMAGQQPGLMTGRNIYTAFPALAGSVTADAFTRAMEQQNYTCTTDYFGQSDLWMETHIYPSPGGMSVFIKDITERKKAEERLFKANRMYFFISHINKMIVRTTDEATLFKEACQIAVDFGNFSMAWIGKVDAENKQVIPIVHAGEDRGFLAKITPISTEDTPEGRGPTGKALAEGKYMFCNDIETDPRMAPWAEAAAVHGYLSAVALPIIKSGKTVAVFTLYAAVKNFFDIAEISILEEAAGDISFALENFEKDTIRKQAQEALLKSEQRYQALAEISPVGVFHTDADGLTTYVNPRWCSISGLPHHKALANDWLNAVHEEDRDQLLNSWKKAAGDEQPSSSEYRFIRPDGSIAWVMGLAIPEKDKENRVIGYVGTTTDITERKKAEAAIEKSEKRFRSTLDKMLEGVQIYDFGWRCIYVNDTVARQGPYSKEQILGQRLTDNYPYIEKTPLFRIFEQCRNEKISRHIEYEFTFPDSSKKWFELSIQPNPDGIFVLSVDISERKKAEEALLTSNKQLRMSQQIAHVGYWELDVRNKSYYWSDEMYPLFGMENDGTVPDTDTFMTHVHPEDKDALRASYRSVIENNQPMQVEFRFILKDGRVRHFYSTGNLMTGNGADGSRVNGTTQDITEQKKAEQEIVKEKNLSDSIINSLPGIFYLYSREGNFLRWNKNFEEVTAYSPGEIRKMHPLDFYDTDEKEGIQLKIEEVFSKGTADTEAEFYTKDRKKIPYYFTGIDIIYGGRHCLMGVGIDISERIAAQETIKENAAQLRQLAAHLQDVREEERASIAREIHDELGQQLTGLKMDIYWLKTELTVMDKKSEQYIDDILKLTDESINTVRKIAAALRPSILDDLGLPEALEWHSAEFAKRFGIDVLFTTGLKGLEVAPKTAIGLFRIYQECLTNVARHANAKQIISSLTCAGKQIVLKIADNGKGFDTREILHKKTLGLVGMQERVLMMEGKYTLESKPGAGTSILVTVPAQNGCS